MNFSKVDKSTLTSALEKGDRLRLCDPKATLAIRPNINNNHPCFSNASNCSIGTGLPNRYPW